jgi:hypothetical protein
LPTPELALIFEGGGGGTQPHASALVFMLTLSSAETAAAARKDFNMFASLGLCSS